MQGLDQLIAGVLSTLGNVQVIDPKLSLLKQITASYLIESKGSCELMVANHLDKISCVDSLELYVKQHYDESDLTNIYKQAYFHG